MHTTIDAPLFLLTLTIYCYLDPAIWSHKDFLN